MTTENSSLPAAMFPEINFDHGARRVYPRQVRFKSELNWAPVWQTRRHSGSEIARCIDGFCDPIRRDLSLGY